jgi:hypothetical protein
MIELAGSRQLFSATFSALDEQEVVITNIPDLGNTRLLITFVPGESGPSTWAPEGEHGIRLWVRGWPANSWAVLRGDIGKVHSTPNAIIWFNLAHVATGTIHQVILELYVRAA